MRYLGQVESGPVWSEIEKVAARYPEVWAQIYEAAAKYPTVYGVQRSEFINPSVIGQKIYQWRYGIPPQGPVEEAAQEAIEKIVEPIIGPSPTKQNGTMILIAGAVGVAILAWTMRPRRRQRR